MLLSPVWPLCCVSVMKVFCGEDVPDVASELIRLLFLDSLNGSAGVTGDVTGSGAGK